MCVEDNRNNNNNNKICALKKITEECRYTHKTSAQWLFWQQKKNQSMLWKKSKNSFVHKTVLKFINHSKRAAGMTHATGALFCQKFFARISKPCIRLLHIININYPHDDLFIQCSYLFAIQVSFDKKITLGNFLLSLCMFLLLLLGFLLLFCFGYWKSGRRNYYRKSFMFVIYYWYVSIRCVININ